MRELKGEVDYIQKLFVLFYEVFLEVVNFFIEAVPVVLVDLEGSG